MGDDVRIETSRGSFSLLHKLSWGCCWDSRGGWGRLGLEKAHRESSGQLLWGIPERLRWKLHMPYLPVVVDICSLCTVYGCFLNAELVSQLQAASVHVPSIWPAFGFFSYCTLLKCTPFPSSNFWLNCSSCKQQLVLDPPSHNPHSSNRSLKPHL